MTQQFLGKFVILESRQKLLTYYWSFQSTAASTSFLYALDYDLWMNILRG